MEAVKQNGTSLLQCSKKMKGDKEVVTAAVSMCGESLQQASRELQEDEDVVTAAHRTARVVWARPHFRFVAATVSCSRQQLSTDSASTKPGVTRSQTERLSSKLSHLMPQALCGYLLCLNQIFRFFQNQCKLIRFCQICSPMFSNLMKLQLENLKESLWNEIMC